VWTAKDVRERYEDLLINLPGVVGVTANPTHRIILLVKSPEYIDATPNVIDGIPVEKVVVGDMRALASPASRGRVRPLVGGISISPPELIAGTLGVITDDEVMLTNAHVAAVNYRLRKFYPKNTKIYQPGWLDGGRDNDVVGELLLYTKIDTKEKCEVDGATCSILPGIQYKKMEIMGIGEVDGWEIPKVGQEVRKVGRTTGLVSSIVMAVDATVKIGGYPWGYTVFRDCIITVPAIGAPGDSGSVLVSQENHLAGLLFGGSDSATAACRMDHVISELGISLGRRYRSTEPNVLAESVENLAKGIAVALAPAVVIGLAEVLKDVPV